MRVRIDTLDRLSRSSSSRSSGGHAAGTTIRPGRGRRRHQQGQAPPLLPAERSNEKCGVVGRCCCLGEGAVSMCRPRSLLLEWKKGGAGGGGGRGGGRVVAVAAGGRGAADGKGGCVVCTSRNKLRTDFMY